MVLLRQLNSGKGLLVHALQLVGGRIGRQAGQAGIRLGDGQGPLHQPGLPVAGLILQDRQLGRRPVPEQVLAIEIDAHAVVLDPRRHQAVGAARIGKPSALPVAPAHRLRVDRHGGVPQRRVVFQPLLGRAGVGFEGPLLLPLRQALVRVIKRRGFLPRLACHLSELVVQIDIVQEHHGKDRGGVDRQLHGIRARLGSMKEEFHDRVELVDGRAALAVMVHLAREAVVDIAIDDQALAHPLDIFRGRGGNDAHRVRAGRQRAQGQLDRRALGIPGDHLDRLVELPRGLRILIFGDRVNRLGVIADPVPGEAGQLHRGEILQQCFSVVKRRHGNVALQFHAHMLHGAGIRDALGRSPRRRRRLVGHHARPARLPGLARIQGRPGKLGDPVVHRGDPGGRRPRHQQTRHHNSRPKPKSHMSILVRPSHPTA